MSAETVPAEAGLTFAYTNWRGETAERRVAPDGIRFRFGRSEWHAEPQWLMCAYDFGKAAHREFAVRDIVFGPDRTTRPPEPSLPAEAGENSISAIMAENARLHTAMLILGAYLIEKGEAFRVGEGAELLDAYSAALSPSTPADKEVRADMQNRGPYEARLCKGMPADCCDYGVVSLSDGVEVCRVWKEQDARVIASLLGAVPSAEAGESEAVAWLVEGNGWVELFRNEEAAIKRAAATRATVTRLVPASTLAAERAAHEETRRRLAEEIANMEATMKGWDALCAKSAEEEERVEARIRSLEERLATAGTLTWSDPKPGTAIQARAYTPFGGIMILQHCPEDHFRVSFGWRDDDSFAATIEEAKAVAANELRIDALAVISTLPPQPGVTHGDASQDGSADHG